MRFNEPNGRGQKTVSKKTGGEVLTWDPWPPFTLTGVQIRVLWWS
jgi:hypothetical protein